MDELICNRCKRPFFAIESAKCKCPYDEDMEKQLRSYRSEIIRNEPKDFINKGRESKTFSITLGNGQKKLNR